MVSETADYVVVKDPEYGQQRRLKDSGIHAYFPTFAEAKAWLTDAITRDIAHQKKELEVLRSRLDLAQKLEGELYVSDQPD